MLEPCSIPTLRGQEEGEEGREWERATSQGDTRLNSVQGMHSLCGFWMDPWDSLHHNLDKSSFDGVMK